MAAIYVLEFRYKPGNSDFTCQGFRTTDRLELPAITRAASEPHPAHGQARPSPSANSGADAVRARAEGSVRIPALATVVSVPTPHRAIIDAGSKCLTSDLLGLEGYGAVPGRDDILIDPLSEEPGRLVSPGPIGLPPSGWRRAGGSGDWSRGGIGPVGLQAVWFSAAGRECPALTRLRKIDRHGPAHARRPPSGQTAWIRRRPSGEFPDAIGSASVCLEGPRVLMDPETAGKVCRPFRRRDRPPRSCQRP